MKYLLILLLFPFTSFGQANLDSILTEMKSRGIATMAIGGTTGITADSTFLKTFFTEPVFILETIPKRTYLLSIDSFPVDSIPKWMLKYIIVDSINRKSLKFVY